MSTSPLGAPSHRYVEYTFGPRWAFGCKEALTEAEVTCLTLLEQMPQTSALELETILAGPEVAVGRDRIGAVKYLRISSMVSRLLRDPQLCGCP